MINYQLNENIFRPGDLIRGSCQWLPSGDEAKQKATLTVGWRTEGRGDVDREFIYEAEIYPHQLAQFHCKIPLNAYPSYDGQLLRIIWEVRVYFTSRGLKGILGMKESPEAETFRVVGG